MKKTREKKVVEVKSTKEEPAFIYPHAIITPTYQRVQFFSRWGFPSRRIFIACMDSVRDDSAVSRVGFVFSLRFGGKVVRVIFLRFFLCHGSLAEYK